MKVRKAVFPVAGLGTRLLPASKALPKEMLPIIDRPLIQYAVDEAVAAGCDTLVFVVNRHKHAIADHFDRAHELEQRLEKTGKNDLLELVRGVLPQGVRTIFVTQSEALGLGHAVLCAEHAVGDEPFAVLLPDDLIWNRGGPQALAQMVAESERLGASMVAVEDVPREQTGRYGIVSVDAPDGRSARIRGMVEKPRPEVAPSTLAVVGRYVLHPRVFQFLRSLPPGAGGEIQLTDAIEALRNVEPVCAYRFEGERFDCGNKLGVVEATMAFALEQPDIAGAVAARMRRLLGA
ncbi:MAG: UTP--glucose-1-phosphate uridylyltransferase GalU [Xanthomonadaceae bacterium]|jgi:UTP--glucose-1-phosphate uridylyltransferase|nr:UTP--glucose-1-phosphate uridylyltransferase GalU [Xanthomonadaceae bacterium]